MPNTASPWRTPAYASSTTDPSAERPIDWQRYKALCDRPDVLSRWMLMETASLLEEPLRAAVLAGCHGTPLAKPGDHKGGVDTDMFEVALSADEVRNVLSVVEDAAQRGMRTPRSARLGGFVAAWRELKQWHDAQV